MGFQVPSDLEHTSLSLQQVRQIIANRSKRKSLQNRINALPQKEEDMVKEMMELAAADEAVILADREARQKDREAAAKTAAP